MHSVLFFLVLPYSYIGCYILWHQKLGAQWPSSGLQYMVWCRRPTPHWPSNQSECDQCIPPPPSPSMYATIPVTGKNIPPKCPADALSIWFCSVHVSQPSWYARWLILNRVCHSDYASARGLLCAQRCVVMLAKLALPSRKKKKEIAAGDVTLLYWSWWHARQRRRQRTKPVIVLTSWTEHRFPLQVISPSSSKCVARRDALC